MTLNFYNDEEKDFDWNKPLSESKNFVVLPSLGSFIPNWLLVLPKEEQISFAKVNKEHFLELQDLVNHITHKLDMKYYSIFEHGPLVAKSKVGCSKDYAHIHIVPHEIKMNNPLLSEYKWKKFDNWISLLNSIDKNKEYLFFGKGEQWFLTQSMDFQSQFFRKIIANDLNLDRFYDWRKFPFYSNVNQTIKSFNG